MRAPSLCAIAIFLLTPAGRSVGLVTVGQPGERAQGVSGHLRKKQ